jgi:tRNA (guanine37-N1)-methyltransferase
MKITILTLFPEMISPFFDNSIIKRAKAKGIIDISIINIRDFTKDRYGRVDSAPVGGGAGLIMKMQPLIDALDAVKTLDCKVYLLAPTGQTFNQEFAHELTKVSHLILICGHYEGIDDRINYYIDGTISIGDYILTGGEIGAVAISDAVIRLLEGAISEDSTTEETFENGLLEYPQFTEPFDYNGYQIPDILYSGNHTAIAKWRKKEALRRTRSLRPDLFEAYSLNKSERKLLQEIDDNKVGDWEKEAIAKGHKFIKKEDNK